MKFPIPGGYSGGESNPFTEMSWVPIYTNATGMVEFTNLQFSITGIATNSTDGIYFIEFVCDGVSSGLFPITVVSSIQTVNWITQPPSQVVVQTDSQYDFSIVLQLLNSDGNGVEGKIPRVINVTPSGNILLRSRTDLSMFQDSSSDGIITLFIKITQMTQNSGT